MSRVFSTAAAYFANHERHHVIEESTGLSRVVERPDDEDDDWDDDWDDDDWEPEPDDEDWEEADEEEWNSHEARGSVKQRPRRDGASPTLPGPTQLPGTSNPRVAGRSPDLTRARCWRCFTHSTRAHFIAKGSGTRPDSDLSPDLTAGQATVVQLSTHKGGAVVGALV